jgi:hypothetical protein
LRRGAELILARRGLFFGEKRGARSGAEKKMFKARRYPKISKRQNPEINLR